MFEVSPINPAQLQRKLQEKALEEKKKREEAAANILTIHNLLEASKKIGMDVREYEEGLKEVQKYMRERLFADAAKKSSEVVSAIREGIKKMSDEKVSKLKALVEQGERLGTESEKLKSMLESVEKHIENNDYIVALKEAEEAIKEAESLASSYVESVIESTSRLINALKDVVNTSEAEEILEEAKAKMSEGKIEEVLPLCESAQNKLKDVAGKAIERLSTDAELDITILERLGVDVKPYEERLKKAKESAGSEAINEIMEVSRVVREAVRVSISGKIEELASEEEEIKEMGGNVQDLYELIEKAKENLEKNNLALAAETIERGKKLVEDTKFNMVVNAMNPAFNKIKAAAKIGADISSAEKMLLDARNALKLGKYKEAMELSKKCETILDKIMESYKKTTELLPELEKLFTDAEKSGADTSEAKRLLIGVKQALSKKDFVSAYKLAVQTKDALIKGKLEGIKEKMRNAKSLIEIADAYGIDVVEPDVSVQEAEKALEAGDEEKASEMIDDAIKEMKKRIEETLSKEFVELGKKLEPMKEYVDIEEEKKAIIKGKKSMEFGDYESAFSAIDEIKKSIDEMGKEIAEKSVEDAKNSAEELIASEDVDTAELEDLVAEMLALYKEGKYAEAFEASKKVIEKANSLAKTMAQKSYNKARANLNEVRKIREIGGIDLRQFQDSLIEAKAEFKRRNYLNCARISTEISESIETFLSSYKNAVAALGVAQSIIKESEEKGMNAAKYKKMLIEAKKNLKNGKFKEALDLAETITNSLQGVSGKEDLNARLRLIEAKIFSAKTLGIELENYEEKMEEIQKAINEDKLEEGSYLADELEKDIEERFRGAIEKKISMAATLVEDAKEIGINVSKAEEDLLVAKDAFDKKDYIEAYRYADEAQKIIDEIRNVSKKVAEKIKQAQDRIREAEGLRADVRNAVIVLDRAIEALKNNRTNEAMKLAEESLEVVEKAEDEKIRKVIGDFKRLVEKSKKTGMDTSLAENLIHQAENALERKDYEKALSLAMQSEAELEKVELQKDIGEKAIETLKKKVEESAKKGIAVGDVVVILNKAEGAFEAGAYIKSFEYAMQGNEKLREILSIYERIEQEMSELEMKVKEARENQIEVVDASDMAMRARSALNGGDVEKAREFMAKALKTLDKALLGHVDDIIGYAEAKIKYAKKLGANVAEAEGAIKEAKKIKDKEPSKALRLANGARAMIERMDIDTSFVDRAYGINFEISKAKKYGVDISPAENLLKEAIEKSESDKEAADELLSKSMEEIKRIIGQLTPKLEMKINAEGLEKGKWKEAVVSISNTGAVPAKDVKLSISGGIQIDGMKDIEEIGKGGIAEIPVRIMANKEGEINVEGRITAKRTFDGKQFEFTSTETLKTKEKPKARVSAKLVVAEKEEKCRFCNGKIKPGMKMVVCGNCGATYHEPCAKRAGTCKVCGAPLSTGEKPKVVRKKLALKLG